MKTQFRFRTTQVATLTFFVGALLTGSAVAQSSVTLYGQVDSYIGTTRTPGSDRSFILGGGGMQTSYWGIKGTEDLGGGLKTIFDLNAFYRVDTGKGGSYDGEPFFARNAFVGLEHSSYGQVRLGRNTTPYFISTILFNPIVDSYVFGPAISHTYLSANNGKLFDPGVLGDTGWVNSIVYSTPNFNGLTVNAIYAFGEQPGSNGQNKWGGNIMYFRGPFAATVAFQQVKFNTNPGDVTSPASLVGFQKQNAVQAGISYDFSVVKVYAQGQYIKSEINGPSGDLKHVDGLAGVSVPIGAGSLLLTYAYGKSENDVASFHRNTASIAYDYNLSKRTDLYAAYYYDKLSGQAHGDAAGIGIRHRF
ncbi:porin [Cupriavidus taiwanensis]|nr:porin [Cupriavidus taiwanensis]